MEIKKVTLVVIVYNVEAFLRQCLDSVINQTYKELQIIIVDDGSTDGSEKICDEYGLLDDRVQVIHQKNGGISAARNAAIDVALGEYIMFVDSDDFLQLDAIEKLVKIAVETKADIVNCSINMVDEGGEYLSSKYINENDATTILYERQFWEKCKSNITAIVAWSKLYSRNIWENNRYPIGKIHEDEGTLKDILSVCNYIACTKYIGYNYRIRKNSIVRESFTIKNLDKSEFLAERLQYFIDKGYKEYYMYTFGEGARILVKAYTVLDYKGDKGIREKIDNQYKLYKGLTKKLRKQKNSISVKDKLQLRFFEISLKMYKRIRNITSGYKI